MPLAPRDRLGPYEILSPLGSGGMGEVWKARDTRLDREIAIKVSKEQFGERFEREARAVAVLNHPNVCSLYDVGPNYLVMELVEGAPLAPPGTSRKLLDLAVQIADGLAAAHAAGIVHRDLKPLNILVTHDGRVKILDFGLAKLASEAASAAADTTRTMTITDPGTTVGTVDYMSPEQARGSTILTPQSDQFSLGLVLYELCAGKRAFSRPTKAETMTAIIREDPEPLPEIVPAPLRWTIERLLAKDPADRYDSTRDLYRELRQIRDRSSESVSAQGVPAVRKRSTLGWIVIAASLVAILAATAYELRPRNGATRRAAIRFLIQPPANNEWGDAINNQTIAISPEGGRLAFIGRAVDQAEIWIRSLDSLQPRPLVGTQGAYSLFWAADSRSVIFFADGKLKKVPIAGGPPQTLCEFGESVWKGDTLPNGDFLVNTNSGVFRVSSSGTAIPLPNKLFLWPEILPDGEHVLYRRRQSPMTWIQSIHSDAATGLIPTDSRVEYAPPSDAGDPGYLLYLKGGTLMAQPFDGRRLRIEGEPIAIDQGIPYFEPTGGAPISVSRDGILVYQTGLSRSRLVWVDRAGRELSKISEPAPFFGTPRLSPDDQKVVISQRTSDNGGADIWIFERGRQGPTRLTSDPGIEGQPTWSPDGKRIVFSSAQKAQPQLWWKNVADSGRGEAVSPGPFQIPTDWSKDGSFILFQTTGGDTDAGVWAVPTEAGPDASRRPVPLIQDHFTNGGGAFSPDGKWVAFVSSAAGKPDVYVQAFQGGDQPKIYGERHRISTEGGTLPRWRRDGKELFFVSGDNRLMAVEIKLDPAFQAAEPVALFRLQSPAVLAIDALGFDVARDGQHFIVGVMDAAGSPSLTMIVNWQAGLSESRAR